jgi:voltage-gated potassium channel
VNNALRAGADEVIQSNKLTSVFMVNSLHSNGDGLLSNIVHELQDSRLSSYRAKDEEIGRSFTDVCHILLKNGFLLIGIQRGDETFLNPSHSLQIEENDRLLIFK